MARHLNSTPGGVGFYRKDVALPRRHPCPRSGMSSSLSGRHLRSMRRASSSLPLSRESSQVLERLVAPSQLRIADGPTMAQGHQPIRLITVLRGRLAQRRLDLTPCRAWVGRGDNGRVRGAGGRGDRRGQRDRIGHLDPVRSASTTLRHRFVEFSVQGLACRVPFPAVGAC